MKPTYDLTIHFGVKGAVATAGCVTLAYGEGQENEMIEDFKKYLECPAEFEKMYGKTPPPAGIGGGYSTLSEGPLQAGGYSLQAGAVHGRTRKQF